jgi:anti-sigma B factor antagonist
MNIESRTEGSVLIVRPLSKRVDASVAREFREKLEGLIAEGTDRVVLDMEEVEFIDSSGLGAIVSVFRRMNDGQHIAITRPKKTVLSLLKLTRMDKVFQIFAEVEEAVTAVTT